MHQLKKYQALNSVLSAQRFLKGDDLAGRYKTSTARSLQDARIRANGDEKAAQYYLSKK
jgi:hypothetical protein